MAELDRAAISGRLQQARVDAGISQEELADILQVHVNSIQNWESLKKSTIPFDRLEEWATATGTSKGWLLHGEDAILPAEAEELQAQMAELREMLAEVLRRMPDSKGDSQA